MPQSESKSKRKASRLWGNLG